MLVSNLLCAACLALSPGQSAKTIPPPLASSEAPRTDWRMVLDADLILKVRVDSSMCPVPENPGYEEMIWPVLDLVKGDRTPSPKVHVLVYPNGPNGKVIHLLNSLQGKDALVFLIRPDESSDSSVYICDFTDAVQPFDSGIAQAIRLELQNQKEMAASIEEVLNSKPQPLEAEVEALIQLLRSPATYQTPTEELDPINAPDGAFTFPQPINGLEKLGRAALPAIIKHLNDRQRLPDAPVQVELDIRHRPGAFEGIYHTRAYEMRDMLFFPLEELAGQTFGGGGTTNASRDKAVQGWRLYLGHDPVFRRALMESATP